MLYGSDPNRSDSDNDGLIDSVDADAPTVALDYALDTVGPGQVIAFKIEDPNSSSTASGIETVQILFNDEATAFGVQPEYDGCWCFAFPSMLTGQTATITVGVKDRVGNVNSGNFSFTIDNAAPRIDVPATLINGTVQQATDALVIQGIATDAKTSIEENSVQVQLSNALGEPVSSYLMATVATAATAGATQNWQATQAFESAPYGAYQLAMSATDLNGNQVDTTASSPLC